MLKSLNHDEVAIVGYACRLPGASDPDQFWDVLANGRCTIGEIGADRWSHARFGHPDMGALGRSYTFAAGQIDDPYAFDAGFFGISPREAEQMDPQQRLLLQVAWEALEKAGKPASTLPKDRTGVFVGASSSDYSNRFYMDPAAIDAQFMTGNTLSLISNRISYALDLNGPSYTVDTACSSGLYALNEAFQAIRGGVIDTALVGGVNLLLSPYPFIGFSRATMLSKQGLCRAFDADGDGYVRSEGAVVVVLKALETAIADHDRVLGVISGVGVNSDGRTNGVSMPSPVHQEALLHDVYRRFDIDPAWLGFIEAHGTGTRVGDPVETHALGKALGARRDAPLPIGSAKTNVGHLEAGSGLVGLLKAQLALEKGMVPQSLHFDTPNPDIDFDALNLRVVEAGLSLDAQATPHYAGVNSFGFGGANAHVVLRQPRAEEIHQPPHQAEPAPLILSARSAESLAALARAYRARLEAASGAEAARIANAAAYRRERLPHRLIAAPRDREGQIAALDAYANGVKSPLLAAGRAGSRDTRTAFVFSGNGAQFVGMGRAAYANDPVFRARFDSVSVMFEKLAEVSLVEAMHDDELDRRLSRTALAQPLLFAVQVATVESLSEKGLKPDAVLGHSVGEVAAAWAAGVFDLPDAVRLIFLRSKNQESIRGFGSMAAVLASAEAVTAAIADGGFSELCVAADNSPRSVTISGAEAQMTEFGKFARARRMAMKKLDLDYPFHSPIAEFMKDDLLDDLDWLRPQESRIDFVSATYGRVADGQALGPVYWWSNIRQPVLFRQGFETLLDLDCGNFVEIGPRPVLTAYMRDSAADKSRPVSLLPTLEENDPDADLRRVAAQAATQGARLAETRFFGADAKTCEDLPLYPWRNASYRAASTDEALRLFDTSAVNPLLGMALRDGARDWRALLDARAPAWLADHKVGGAVVLPAAGYVDMALAAGREALGDGAIEVMDLDILRPLALEDGVGHQTRVTLGGDRQVLDIESRRRLDDDDFALNARARLRQAAGPRPAPRPAPAPDPARTMTGDAIYALTERFGLDYGPAFRRAVSVLRLDEKRAHVTLDPAHPALDLASHELHPALLDAAFHGLFALIAGQNPDGSKSFLPTRIGRLTLHAPHAAATGVWITVTRASARGVEARFDLTDATGEAVAVAEGVRFKAVQLARPKSPAQLTYRNALERLAPAGGARSDLGARIARLAAKPGAGKPPITAAAPPEPGPGALLMDTTTRRVALDAIAPLASESGIVDTRELLAEGRLAASSQVLLERIFMALEEDEALLRTEDGRALIAPETIYPELSELTEALFAEAPRRIVELARLMDLRATLPGLFADGLSDAGAEARTAAQLRLDASGPAGEARWAALATLLDAVLADKRSGAKSNRRLSVLILGAAPAQMLDRVAAAEIARCVISDPDPRRARALAMGDAPRTGIAYCDFADLPATADFSLVLAGDALSRMSSQDLAALRVRMAPGGAFAAVEDAPGLFADLAEGRDADWWRDTVDPTLPIGRQKTEPEWEAALAEAGFAKPAVAHLASSETQAHVIFAAAPARAPANAASRAGDDAADAPPAAIRVLSETAETGFAPALAEALRAAGRDARAIAPDALAASGANGKGDGAGGPAPVELVLTPPDTRDPDPLDAAHARVMQVRAALASGAPVARLWIVARGAVPAGAPRRLDPAEAALWGLARVVANEFPDIDIRFADLALDLGPDAALTALKGEILAPGADRETVHDPHGRFGVRVERALDLADRAGAAKIASVNGGAMRRLELNQQGAIDSLEWRVEPREAPGAQALEIEVAATGLNFRDIMWAQGLLPEEALEDGFAGPTLGMECSGVVTRVGEGCARYEVGDRVIAFAPSCFATHVLVHENAVAPLPEGVDLIAAASIPTTFLTAYYGLVELARLAAGETVLIHGGAGGVGLAALQIAAARGARVIATAGSPAKRGLLRELGAWKVFDSRALDFPAQVMAATDGLGVDAVLNSLSGEAMERSIECLRPFGRFIELGKRDFYANSQIGLRPFRRNLSYFGVDADQLLVYRPQLAIRVFEALGEGFARGDYIPLPHIVFDPAEVVDAFRLMQKSGHIGKIIVRPPPKVSPQKTRPPRIKRSGAYLVAGGLGGFGVETAAWLVEKGARHIWLTSRSGRVSDDARAAIRRMEAQGAKVATRAADAADRNAMRALIGEIEGGPARLRGVLHTAMTIDDGLFANLDAARIRSVLRPKIAGAAVLDDLTRDLKLDLFVVYSSATTLIGNPGQAAYVAANAYLEALMAERRRARLPGLAVAWGAIGDAGYLTRNAETQDILADRMGGQSLAVREALAGLDLALAAPTGRDMSAVAYALIDWAAAKRELAVTATPLFARMEMPETATAGEGAADLAALVEGMSEAQALRAIADLLAAETSRILRLPAGEIDPQQPLTELGFDSLMAVDLRMAAEEKLGVDIPLMSLAGGASLMDIAARVLKRIGGGAAEDEADDNMQALIARHAGEGADIDAGQIAELSRRAETQTKVLH